MIQSSVGEKFSTKLLSLFNVFDLAALFPRKINFWLKYFFFVSYYSSSGVANSIRVELVKDRGVIVRESGQDAVEGVTPVGVMKANRMSVKCEKAWGLERVIKVEDNVKSFTFTILNKK